MSRKPEWMKTCSGINCDVCKSRSEKGQGECLEFNNEPEKNTKVTGVKMDSPQYTGESIKSVERDVMSNIRLSEVEIEKIHYRFLTDRIIQGYNSQIQMLMQSYIPSYIMSEEGLKVMYKPDDAYEIKRVHDLRDIYIVGHYPELVINQETGE